MVTSLLLISLLISQSLSANEANQKRWIPNLRSGDPHVDTPWVMPSGMGERRRRSIRNKTLALRAKSTPTPTRASSKDRLKRQLQPCVPPKSQTELLEDHLHASAKCLQKSCKDLEDARKEIRFLKHENKIQREENESSLQQIEGLEISIDALQGQLQEARIARKEQLEHQESALSELDLTREQAQKVEQIIATKDERIRALEDELESWEMRLNSTFTSYKTCLTPIGCVFVVPL